MFQRPLLMRHPVLYRFLNDAAMLQLYRSDAQTAALGSTAVQSEIDIAITTWRQVYQRLRQSAVADGSWDGLGFWKNGDQYELIIRLLLSDVIRPHLNDILKPNVDRLQALKSWIIR